VPAGGRLLDVGCGTGALLSALAERVPEALLTGIDPSGGMLAVGRRRLGDDASLVQGYAERLPFADGVFDTVVSMNALHYFPAPDAGLAEMRRVLRPTGRAVITDWCDDFLACRLCELWLRRVDPAHVRTYGSDDLRRMLSAAGFSVTALERYKISWLWGLMTALATPA